MTLLDHKHLYSEVQMLNRIITIFQRIITTNISDNSWDMALLGGIV